MMKIPLRSLFTKGPEMKWIVAIFFVCSTAYAADENKLTVEHAKKLLPQAAGMINADLDTLGRDPRPEAVKSKSLTLMLLAYNPVVAEQNPKATKEFSFTGEVPKPSEIIAAIAISKQQGYASFIQPKYITDCTCESKGDKAEGSVSFKCDLYSGRVLYSARRIKDVWTITEFRLPIHEIRIVRGENDVWKQESLPKK